MARVVALACIALFGLATAATSADAAQKRNLGTITLCIEQKAPDRGSIRFVKTNKKCLNGEKRARRALRARTDLRRDWKLISSQPEPVGPNPTKWTVTADKDKVVAYVVCVPGP